MERHELLSQRLRLEPTGAHHAAKVFGEISDERLWKFFPSLRPHTLEDLRALYRRWERGNPYANRDELWENWVCFLRESETPVGGMQATLLPGNIAHLAYVIYSKHQRQGYAREAGQAVLDHLRGVHGVKRVLADMNVENEASIKVVEALGFTRIEERSKVQPGHGSAANEYVYELTWNGTGEMDSSKKRRLPPQTPALPNISPHPSPPGTPDPRP
ncbi:MAG: hypothetical protein NVS9B12_12730 [Vulcanimicrobiaceae bacterium]